MALITAFILGYIVAQAVERFLANEDAADERATDRLFHNSFASFSSSSDPFSYPVEETPKDFHQ